MKDTKVQALLALYIYIYIYINVFLFIFHSPLFRDAQTLKSVSQLVAKGTLTRKTPFSTLRAVRTRCV